VSDKFLSDCHGAPVRVVKVYRLVPAPFMSRLIGRETVTTSQSSDMWTLCSECQEFCKVKEER